MKVGIVFGTRPEIIKVAPVYLKAKERGIDAELICTGQHREMVDMMKEIFEIETDYDMDIMTHNQTLNDIAYKVIREFENFAKKKTYSWILVQGDTTTAMSAAIAAFNMKLKVGHIEAGLRSGNLYDPFPEEMNRKVIDQISAKLFPPTEHAKNALLKENFSNEKIVLTGNTVIDAQMYILNKFNLERIRKKFLDHTNYFIVTLHRRETIGERMNSILKAIRKFAEEEKIEFIFPVHKNQSVRKIVYSELSECKYAKLIEPVNYLEMTALLKDCKFVATDSGGLQEEAPTFKKFVVVCRQVTERPEVIHNGWGVLAGTHTENIYKNLKKALEFVPSDKPNPFGDGRASERIIDAIVDADTDVTCQQFEI